MGRGLDIIGDELGVRMFDEIEMAATQDALVMANLMLEERRLRVQAFSDTLGALLGMNTILDGWAEITRTDPAALLN